MVNTDKGQWLRQHVPTYFALAPLVNRHPGKRTVNVHATSTPGGVSTLWTLDFVTHVIVLKSTIEKSRHEKSSGLPRRYYDFQKYPLSTTRPVEPLRPPKNEEERNP